MSVIIPGSNLAPKISFTTNGELANVAPILTTSGTVTGSKGWGSSLFLQRIFIPAAMALTEVDLALNLSFAATNQGAGTMSESMMIYSFGNATSLATVATASSAFVWTTGTSTVAGSTSLTQFQGGWSTALINPMTFASTLLTGGEYVIGNLINFAQASSTWSVTLYGEPDATTSSHTQFALTSVSGVLTSGYTSLSSTTFRFATLSATTVTSSHSGTSLTVFTGSATASSQVSAVNQSSATSSYTVGFTSLPSFGYIGTGATTSAVPSVFIAGIMSTGASLASIALTSTAVTYTGSTAWMQPWFALIGQ